MSNDSLRNQLERHYPHSRSKTQLIEANLPPLSTRKVDGVDHLNIWESGKTKLGKFLAIASPNPFVHPVFGPFNSVECFWHYIRSQERDDRLRTMSSAAVRKFSRRLKTAHTPNFYAVIMYAVWHKLSTNKQMIERLRTNDLPLDMYYIFRDSGLPIRSTSIVWMMPGFVEIEKAVKENREPDFSFLLSEPTTDLYSPLLPENIQATKTDSDTTSNAVDGDEITVDEDEEVSFNI